MTTAAVSEFCGRDRARNLCIEATMSGGLPPRSIFALEERGVVRFVKIDRATAFRPFDVWVYAETGR